MVLELASLEKKKKKKEGKKKGHSLSHKLSGNQRTYLYSGGSGLPFCWL